MKQTILKYSSLLALLSSTFFSTQTFAAECETGTVPATGCRIDISDITYTLTGDITIDDADGACILIGTNTDSAIINYTGSISVTDIGVVLIQVLITTHEYDGQYQHCSRNCQKTSVNFIGPKTILLT